MNCKTAKRVIPAFLDGELKPDRAADLRRHLESCPSCREEMAALSSAMEALGAYEGIELSFTLADIRERAARRRYTDTVSGWLWRMPRLVTAAMVLMALAIGSVSGIYYGSRNGSPAYERPAAASKQQVADSFGLDAFDNGLLRAVYVANADARTGSGVTQ